MSAIHFGMKDATEYHYCRIIIMYNNYHSFLIIIPSQLFPVNSVPVQLQMKLLGAETNTQAPLTHV